MTAQSNPAMSVSARPAEGKQAPGLQGDDFENAVGIFFPPHLHLRLARMGDLHLGPNRCQPEGLPSWLFPPSAQAKASPCSSAGGQRHVRDTTKIRCKDVGHLLPR